MIEILHTKLAQDLTKLRDLRESLASDPTSLTYRALKGEVSVQEYRNQLHFRRQTHGLPKL
jgi:hypothetical protein